MIHELMRGADIAQPYRPRTPAGFQEPTSYPATPMIRSFTSRMSGMLLPPPLRGSLSGETRDMDAAVIKNSRVAAAGASVLVLDDLRRAVDGDHDPRGAVAMQDVPVEFRNIEAAVFGEVNVDTEEDAPTIALPVSVASMSWGASLTRAVRFEVPRSFRKKIKETDLAVEVSTALALGLSRAADAVLCSAILATTPANFSLPMAAARGLKFDELSAIVGTAGTGAAIGQDGELRAAGIEAELTPDMAETLIGAWNRSAVAIRDDVTVTAEKIKRDGGIAFTAWASFVPLVPDATAFWKAA